MFTTYSYILNNLLHSSLFYSFVLCDYWLLVGLKEDLQQMHEELKKLEKAYYTIVHPAQLCKRKLLHNGFHIRQVFKQACLEDMKVRYKQ